MEQARRLLRAGQWRQAADRYAEAGSQAQADLYDAGFALAQLGDFAGCLRCWQQLDSAHPDFLAQKKQAAALLIQELRRRLDEEPLAQERNVRLLIEEFAIDSELSGQKLLRRCRHLRLARLWQEGRLRDIMAAASGTALAKPALLDITAKAACQLMLDEAAEFSSAEVRHFINCWLSLLFHPEAGPQTEPLRQALLDFGADLVRRRTSAQPELLRHWDESLALLKQVSRLVLVRDQAVPIYVPALAVSSGLTERIFAAIKQEAAASEELLAAGAAYSPAAVALLMIQEHDYDSALAELTRLAKEDDGAEPFLACGIAQIRTACGLRFFQQGRYAEAEDVLAGLSRLPAALERQLLAVLAAGQDDGQDRARQTACVNILSRLHETVPSEVFAKALAAALREQAILLHRNGEVPPQVLAECLEKALALNPADEAAQKALASIRAEQELVEMEQAVALDNLPEAAHIAAASASPEVAAQFFDFARRIMSQAGYSDEAAALFLLEELLDCVSRVDPGHELLVGIRQKLAARQKRRVA